VGQAAEHLETSVHQTQRQGVSSDYINGTEGGRSTKICGGGDPDVSARAAGHSKETKVSYEEAIESFGWHHPAFVEGW
jgi:hypothetical protein